MFKTNIKNKIFILVFLAILVLPWITGGLLRVISPSTFKKLSVVETEKREMAAIEWSNLLNTGQSVSNYVDDRIPYRYTLITWYRNINNGIEDKYKIVETAIGSHFYSEPQEVALDVEKTNKAIVPGEEVPKPQEDAGNQPSNYFPLEVYQDVIFGRDGWLFLYGENEFECYQGTNILSDQEMQHYADMINQLQSLCDAKGKELYIYIAPNKSSVYNWMMPTVDIVDPNRRIQRLDEYVAAHCSTPFIYPIDEEYRAAQTVQVYYKYDSHWNHMGALYGTNALYEQMGIEQTEPTQWATELQDADKYELYNYMGIPDDMIVHNDVEWAVDYKPEITVNGLDTEAMVCRTTSDGPVDKKLCLIGDSFRVNMIPYLAKDFTKCTFAHRDYMNKVHSDIKNSDVIVIEAVERYDYEGFKSLQRVINVLSE